MQMRDYAIEPGGRKVSSSWAKRRIEVSRLDGRGEKRVENEGQKRWSRKETG